MNGAWYFTQPLAECREPALAGGKAANLGRLIRAGFHVPDGFVVTTRAFRVAEKLATVNGAPVGMPPEVAEEIQLAYRAMGAGPVAVRSSATSEDTEGASMAGQYQTVLDVEGEAGLLDAVRRCWTSLHALRPRAYLHGNGIDCDGLAMAVVVQRLVPATVAGVLFTTNPHQDRRREMLVEASWGLGEAVVSGQVQPDVLHVDRETGQVLSATIADKRVFVAAGARGAQPVDESRRRRACLDGRDVHCLWQIGRRAVEHFGAPQDIEWAIHAGKVYVLQSRPITTLRDVEIHERVLRSMRHQLRCQSAAGRGPWVLHNLAETLPHPTPLTWSVVRRFMSGAGGLGRMYREVGFDPSPALCRSGFLQRIAGRIYMDASRATEMFWADFPFTFDLDELKHNPDSAQLRPTVPRGSLGARLRAGCRLAAVDAKLAALSVDLDHRLHDTLFPEMARYVADAQQVELRTLSADRLIDQWRKHEARVLDKFGPQSLLPVLVGDLALGRLRAFLAERLWNEDPVALSQWISAGGPPSRTVFRDAELYEVGQGKRPLETWLFAHGHRACGEFDLAVSRWREQPEAARKMAARLADGKDPLELHRCNSSAVQQRMAAISASWPAADREEFHGWVQLVWRYSGLREDAKDVLLLGYGLLRDLALEASRRLDLRDDVFFLTRDELFDALHVGFAPYHRVEQRKIAYQAEIRLSLPRMIDQQAIDTLGARPEIEPATGRCQGVAIAPGEARGPARIVTSAIAANGLGRGYILVCPSTDPSWTPLFVNAAGLVLERGGTLSHGAVVAREMGLAAVVLPDATRRFREGEILCIDGTRGWVCPGSLAETNPSGTTTPVDERHIACDCIPPPAGRKECRVAWWSGVSAAVWIVCLLAVFVLPERLAYRPTLAALDVMFWPIVRGLGKPAAVALIAAGIALLTLAVQKVATDNRRLLEAKRRAALLRHMAATLPDDAPRRAALLRLAAPVRFRLLTASLVPLGLLLGPIVLPLVWVKQRVDPAAWNAPAGSAVQIVATVESNWYQPVCIDVPSEVIVDPTSPLSRTLPPIRKTLEHLLTLYRQPRSDPAEPWELKVAPDLARQLTADDLQAYLAAGVPPRGITWLLHPPAEAIAPFAATVTTAGHRPLTVTVAQGESHPPAPRRVRGESGAPIEELRVQYARPTQELFFWRPFGWLLGLQRPAWIGWLANVDVGWFWLYLLVYLLTLLPVRVVWQIA